MYREKRGIPLQKGVIYGPVHSRRIGKSLGINLSPTKLTLCALDCVYCQYGRTQVRTAAPKKDFLPAVEVISERLKAALRRKKALDVITFSGNGEPTLHPQFDKIVTAVLKIRDLLAPKTPLAILSSGAMVDRPKIREALNKLDMRIMKLDAGDEQVFQEINRPVAGLRLDGIVEGLQQLDRVILQTLLVNGPQENCSAEKIKKLIARIREIRPMQVQLYTLVRPPAEASVETVPRGKLEDIAARIRKEAEVKIRVY